MSDNKKTNLMRYMLQFQKPAETGKKEQYVAEAKKEVEKKEFTIQFNPDAETEKFREKLPLWFSKKEIEKSGEEYKNQVYDWISNNSYPKGLVQELLEKQNRLLGQIQVLESLLQDSTQRLEEYDIKRSDQTDFNFDKWLESIRGENLFQKLERENKYLRAESENLIQTFYIKNEQIKQLESRVSEMGEEIKNLRYQLKPGLEEEIE
jgi:predicted phage tail protein